MKLADEIVLGSVAVTLAPREWLTPDDCGCLLGMAMKATGETNARAFLDRHPWLKTEMTTPSIITGHRLTAYYHEENPKTIDTTMLYVWQIISAMAYQVFEGLTALDEAIAWIRDNEPAGPSSTSPIVTEPACAEV